MIDFEEREIGGSPSVTPTVRLSIPLKSDKIAPVLLN
jgi:hypothetical protein